MPVDSGREPRAITVGGSYEGDGGELLDAVSSCVELARPLGWGESEAIDSLMWIRIGQMCRMIGNKQDRCT